jgi:hypothetical protein
MRVSWKQYLVYGNTVEPAYTSLSLFLIAMGGGVQLGPLGTAAANWPIVTAPGDYDDGEIGGMIGWGNRSTRIKPDSVSLCPPKIPHACPDAVVSQQLKFHVS